MAQWHVCPRQDANPQGPFSTQKLRQLAEAGRIRPDMWFSRDGSDWAQNPDEIFGSASGPAPARRAAPRAGGARSRSRAPREEGEREGRPMRAPAKSPAAWVIAGVVVMLLGGAFVLDQWATTRMESKSSTGAAVAIHFGRSATTVAVEGGGLNRGVALSRLGSKYADLGTEPADQTKTYGMLLMILIAGAAIARLASAGMVHAAGSFTGGGAMLWMIGTLLVVGVAVVAVVFNNSGLVAEGAAALDASGSAASVGMGISTWGAFFAAGIDILGIFMVKAAAAAPSRAPRGRARGGRRVRR